MEGLGSAAVHLHQVPMDEHLFQLRGIDHGNGGIISRKQTA
jgi:hypothetical protein